MINDDNSLWPDFEDVPKIVGPRTILSEQANFLAEKTKNLLTATVTGGTTAEGKISLRFRIVAPLLKNYSYTLFVMYHGALYYPCELIYENTFMTLNNEEEVKDQIREIFNNESTKKIIVSLLGQSKELENGE